jgi:dihydroorotate dehydrogenase (NAD+) catalytic subunit
MSQNARLISILAFALIAVVCASSDIITKYAAFVSEEDHTVIIPKVLRLGKTTNEGIVFGWLQDVKGAGTVVLIVAIIAVPIITWLYISTKNPSTPVTIALGMILGGTTGNLYDRAFFGSVRDFIDFYGINWPLFNLADTFICIGVALLTVKILFFENANHSTTPQKVEVMASNANANNGTTHTPQVDLSIDVGPLKLTNPIIVASGTFGGDFDKVIKVDKLGAIVTKTITLEARIGNKPPRLVETPSGLINSIGLENKGLEEFLKEDLPKLSSYKTKIIVSIAGKNTDEYKQLAKGLSLEKCIDALELNLSCPNIEDGLDIGTNPQRLYETVRAVRENSHLPVIAKLTPNVTDIKPLAKSAIDGGADIISLINTIRAIAIDWRKRTPILGNVTGGLSGPAIKPIAERFVWEVVSNFSTPVIGIGGISNAEDVLEFICIGAQAVQIGTANFTDPTVTIKILEELPKLLLTFDIKDIKTMIGTFKGIGN